MTKTASRSGAKPAVKADTRIPMALAMIEACDEPDRLRQLMANARKLDSPIVYDAAFRKFVELLPEAEPGTLEHDFQRMIHSLEQVLAEARGKSVRLTRTRLKATKTGAVRTLTDWTAGPDEAEGLTLLIARGLADLSAEAVILRHPDAFAPEVAAAAQARLDAAAVPV